MEVTRLVCIQCPMGCELAVKRGGDGGLSVSGNTCPRGERYGRAEVSDPRRTVTGTVRVAGGAAPVVSVRTAGEVPKAAVMEVARAFAAIEATAPVAVGDRLAADVAGTGVDVVATIACAARAQGR